MIAERIIDMKQRNSGKNYILRVGTLLLCIILFADTLLSNSFVSKAKGTDTCVAVNVLVPWWSGPAVWLGIEMGLDIGKDTGKDIIEDSINNTMGMITDGTKNQIAVEELDKKLEELENGNGSGGGDLLFEESGWALVDKVLYNGSTDMDGTTPEGTEELDAKDKENSGEASAVEKVLFGPFCSGAIFLWMWFNSWNIDITIDGLVYGRMSTTYDGVADFTHFGLEANNPYGVAGATLYYALRGVILAIIPVMLLILFIRQQLNNGQKGRGQLKELVQNSAVVLVLLFAMPYLLNMFIYVRDACMWGVNYTTSEMYESMGFTEFSFGDSVVSFLMARSMRNPSLINTLLFVAAVGASLFFFGYYVFVAGLLTACFGFFPLVAFISLWNRRILTEWWNIFFPNALLGFIDLFLIQVPSVVHAVYCNVFGSDGSVILCIMLLILIFNITKIRQQIMRLLGYNGIIPGGNGMMGMMLLLMRMVQPPPGNTRGRGGITLPDDPSAARIGAEEALARGELMTEANDRLQKVPALEMEDAVGMHDKGLYGSEGYLSDIEDLYGDVPGGESAEELLAFDDLPTSEEAGESILPEDVGEFDRVSMPEELEGVGDPEMLEDMGDVTAPELSEVPMDVVEASDASVPGNDVLPVVPDTEPDGAFREAVLPKETAGDTSIPRKLPLDTQMDEEFHESLSKIDKGRYENLACMDACSEHIRQNEEFMEKAGYTPGTYKDHKERYESVIARANQDIDTISARMDAVTDKNSMQYQTMQKEKDALVSLRNSNQERLDTLKTAAGKSMENDAYRKHYQSCAELESNYARNNALGGMSDRKYQTADDFKRATQINRIKQKQMDYRNFDSKQYEGILTPQERANFYREREIRAHEMKVEENLKAVGRVAVGTVVGGTMAAFSVYGGPTAVAAAATLGYNAGSRGFNSVANDLGSMPVSDTKEPPKRKTADKPNVSTGNTSTAEVNRIEQERKNFERRATNAENKQNTTDKREKERKEELEKYAEKGEKRMK